MWGLDEQHIVVVDDHRSVRPDRQTARAAGVIHSRHDFLEFEGRAGIVGAGWKGGIGRGVAAGRVGGLAGGKHPQCADEGGESFSHDWASRLNGHGSLYDLHLRCRPGTARCKVGRRVLPIPGWFESDPLGGTHNATSCQRNRAPDRRREPCCHCGCRDHCRRGYHRRPLNRVRPGGRTARQRTPHRVPPPRRTLRRPRHPRHARAAGHARAVRNSGWNGSPRSARSCSTGCAKHRIEMWLVVSEEFHPDPALYYVAPPLQYGPPSRCHGVRRRWR